MSEKPRLPFDSYQKMAATLQKVFELGRTLPKDVKISSRTMARGLMEEMGFHPIPSHNVRGGKNV
jgi:hypothetical protein